jgi:hypothetical protein
MLREVRVNGLQEIFAELVARSLRPSAISAIADDKFNIHPAAQACHRMHRTQPETRTESLAVQITALFGRQLMSSAMARRTKGGEFFDPRQCCARSRSQRSQEGATTCST